MSSVVVEANAQLSNQLSKPKSGQNGQSPASAGFSGLVDSNLAAAAEGEAASPATKPRKAAAAAEQQGAARTGIQRKPKTTEGTQPQAPAAKQPTESRSAETPADTTLAIEVVVKTGLVTANASAELADAAGEAEVEQVVLPSVATTGVVAAVTVPIELAAEVPAEQVIESGETIAAANPPATIVAPAGTAATALARVAVDTAEAGDGAAAVGEAGVQARPTIESGPEATTVEAEVQETLVETAAAEVQLEAKAKTELAATAKAIEPAKPVEQPQQSKLTASIEAKPASVRKEETTAAEQPSQAKPVAHDDHRIEAKADAQAHSDKPAEAEPRPAQKPAPEQGAAPPPPVHNAEKPQPNGFGLTQVAALHVPNVALQAAAFTAIAAASAPVPIGGLAVEIAASAQVGRSRFEIRLDPPELGRIDVRLDVDKQGQVTSHLIVEKSSTLDLLRRDAQQLERALQDAGLKTSDSGLQFSLRDQQQPGRNDDDRSQRNAHRLIVAEEEAAAAEAAGRSYGRRIGQRGGIDIRV